MSEYVPDGEKLDERLKSIGLFLGEAIKLQPDLKVCWAQALLFAFKWHFPNLRADQAVGYAQLIMKYLMEQGFINPKTKAIKAGVLTDEHIQHINRYTRELGLQGKAVSWNQLPEVLRSGSVAILPTVFYQDGEFQSLHVVVVVLVDSKFWFIDPTCGVIMDVSMLDVSDWTFELDVGGQSSKITQRFLKDDRAMPLVIEQL